MARAFQIKQVAAGLLKLAETAFLTRQITRKKRLALEELASRSDLLGPLADRLFGPEREVKVPGHRGFVLRRDQLRSANGESFHTIWLAPPTKPKRRLICLVGHRFSAPVLKSFRWNLRHLLEMYGIKEEYVGWDASAEQVLNELRRKIKKADFCLFDNRETTKPSKPNVYIEAGMAFALGRPFIFCHYRKEVWPSDFSNVNYISYKHERALFAELHAKIPIFIKNRVKKRRRRS